MSDDTGTYVSKADYDALRAQKDAIIKELTERIQALEEDLALMDGFVKALSKSAKDVQ